MKLVPAKTAVSSSSPSSSLFVYGTLMAPEVMHLLLDRNPPHEPARLPGYVRHPVLTKVYPGMVVANHPQATDRTTAVRGMLYTQLTPGEMKRLDWYEGTAYTRIEVQVETTDAKADEAAATTATAYVWSNPAAELDVSQDWSYQHFRDQNMKWYLDNTVQPCREELDRLKM
jgi:gamma-glutamylcyclotransferase (GGCT)/AIG2-like uncharacterized protein YtfP